MKRTLSALIVVPALLFAVPHAATAAAADTPTEPSALPAHAAVQLGQLATYVHAVEQANVVTYVHAVEMANVTDYVNAVASANAAAAAATAPRPAPVVAAGGTATGDCYDGSPVPTYIINRESGGNPAAVNPSSGAYGCYQELPSHFNSGGACAGLSMYSVADQKVCAQRLIDGSGGTLAPWAL